jgi:hypothetical protein
LKNLIAKPSSQSHYNRLTNTAHTQSLIHTKGSLPIIIASTILLSCVAIIIVFHCAFSSSKISIIHLAVSGSRFQVGSSQIIKSGFLTKALAIETLCFSHQLSSCTNLSFFTKSPTCSKTSGTFFLIISSQ